MTAAREALMRRAMENIGDKIAAKVNPMTDISESGIEAAYHKASEAFWEQKRAGGPYSATKHCIKRAISAAIQAYLPFHPPASREEGLTVKALEWAGTVGWLKADRYSITTYLGMDRPYKLEGHLPFSEHFDTLEAAKSAAQEDYQNRVLSAIETALILTKPGAKEQEDALYENLSRAELADTVARYGKALSEIANFSPKSDGFSAPTETAAFCQERARSALQSKKPE